MIMKHVNLTVLGDRAVSRQGRSEQGEDRESTTAVQCETSHREKLQPVPKHLRTDAVVQQRASRWYGHQEETVTANIENETAEVESISSDMASERRQPVQMAQFLQKEIDTQNTNIVVAALTDRDPCGSFSSATGPTPAAATVPAAGPAAVVPDNFEAEQSLEK